MTYHHLDRQQRNWIQLGLQLGLSKASIAQIAGISRATVYREIGRNSKAGYYYAYTADHLARRRQRVRSQRTRIPSETWQRVMACLRRHWSPEQIASSEAVSTEWIYRYVSRDYKAGGHLYRLLRRAQPRRPRRHRFPRRALPTIHARPIEVALKTRVGDWELDTVFNKGRRPALLTLVERKSKLTLISRLSYFTAKNCLQAILRRLRPLEAWVHTLTCDRGLEFSHYRRIEPRLRANFYFADPASPWQRGLVENTNGLLRQYFPRKSDFSKISRKRITAVMHELNNRPRKTLGFKTPYEVFYELTGVALQS